MARIYWSYNSVPELRSLKSEERQTILQVSGRRFGKTPAFKWVSGLNLLLSIMLPIVIWYVVRHYSSDQQVPIIAAVMVGLAGYTLWFHIRISFQVPHIRACLVNPPSEDEILAVRAVVRRFQLNQSQFVLRYGTAFGILFALIAGLTGAYPIEWYLFLPLAIGVGYLWAFIMWYVMRLLNRV
jgi:hypothetical protein